MLFSSLFCACGSPKAQNQPQAPDGSKYLPYEQRTGEESIVYFTFLYRNRRT